MAVNKELIKANEVVAPTLFVGVGGTGCKIVKGVADRCQPSETENINFLCLDTNVNDLMDVARGRKHIYCVQTSNTQTVGSYLDYDDDARKKWFPKNAVMYDKTVSEGAGQVRAISRLALNATIKTGNIRPLYNSIDDLFRKTGKDMKQAMRVVIATTASGGTGSGIILPLSMFIRDYVKKKYPNTSLIVRALVLLPETLDSVISSQTERDSQARNAYATVKELNAFMMKGSGFIDMDEDLKQFKNLGIDVPIAGSEAHKTLSLLPLDFCFLMDGQDSEDSTMISIGQYIEQAAQALYEQNIGPMQRNAFSVEDNIIKEMTKPGNYGRNRFGGIGAGVLRYPYEKIADYVAYDLAIDSIGGEGDATKWTKYDHKIKVYQQEKRKQGVATVDQDREEELYTRYVLSEPDSFSKDLRGRYSLESFEEKIDDYVANLENAAYQAVMDDKLFKKAYLQAETASKKSYSLSGNDKPSTSYSAINKLSTLATIPGRDGKSRIDGIVKRWIDGVFGNEKPTAGIEESYSIEMLLKNVKEVFHPCAARFALYSLLEKFSHDAGAKVASTPIKTIENKTYLQFKFADGEVNGIGALVGLDRDNPSFFDKMKGFNNYYPTVKKELKGYFDAIVTYCKAAAKQAAIDAALPYIKEFSNQYKKFFDTFVYNVKDLSHKKDDLVDELAYRKGDSFVNICSEKDILEELSKFARQKTQNESTMLNTDINGRIFDAVKKNALFQMELESVGGDFIEEDRRVDIFNDILLGYFKESVRENCDDVDKNIIQAIAFEKVLKERLREREESGENTQVLDNVSNEDKVNYIKQRIATGERIAAPSIQKVVNEEPRDIQASAYNKCLLDDRKFRIKELMPKGVPVDTVSKYELRFYNALYNLTPDKLKKFAAPFDTETGHKAAGTYHKAYMEYSKLIGPDSTKNAAVSTHIDKRWDSIKSMPELDFKYQALVIKKIHKAFIYGLIHKVIQHKRLSVVAGGKKAFLYRSSDERDVELIVPNGTLCDEFYEILDALYVNSKVVEDIGLIKNRKRAQSEAKNSNYEDTEFFRDMADFNLLKILPDYDEIKEDFKVEDSYDGNQEGLNALKKKLRENARARAESETSLEESENDGKRYVENVSSLFEIPLMYYCTLPNSARFISEFDAMVDAVIDVFREEYTKWEKEEDVKFLLCTRLTDEMSVLKKNYGIYQKYLHAEKASENPIIDIVQRKIRDVILSAPEPEDYEELLDKVAKEFTEKDEH